MPQFYQWPMALNARGHRHAGIRATPGYDFSRRAMSVPLRASEFAEAVSDYPIVFTDKGTPVPLAILSYEADRNLFVAEDGSWRVEAYLPLYVRRYPFIGMERTTGEISLGIDASSGLFVPRAREGRDLRLFDDEEQLTEVGRFGAALCTAWNEGEGATGAFVEALVETDLLQAGRIEMKLADGCIQVVDGFLAVNETAFRALPPSTVLSWHESGWLDLVTLHLASQRNWARLAAIGAMPVVERDRKCQAARRAGVRHMASNDPGLARVAS
ncbi:MAG: SapC family protein [Alphaproteobacteria bacterium]|nr:SapC family protein [Alphaproteobacteria bacterium]